MKKIMTVALCAVLFSACQKDAVKPATTKTKSVEANWSSSAQYASWSNGGYTVNNDVWGSGAGYQSIWANSYSNWGVWSNQPNTGGVKSYPHATKSINIALNSINSLTSSFNVSTPSGGSWEATYDIWDSGYKNETMLWFNWTGNVGPISYNYGANGAIPVYTNVNVGGYTWTVYRGSNGSNNVYTFTCNSKTNAANVDVKAIQQWIESKGWFGNITQGDVQFGFEITSSNGGMNFSCNSYSVSNN
jgi:hypothetical protein